MKTPTRMPMQAKASTSTQTRTAKPLLMRGRAGDCLAETFDLDGSSSYDDDGDDLRFTWSESTGTLDFSNPWGPVTEATIEEQAATCMVLIVP